MALNWLASDYFSMLIHRDKRSHAALEMLVDDLHLEKERTINRFLSHSGSEDFLWGLVKLLGHSNTRVAGNAAYIIGTLAESEYGSMRILGLTKSCCGESRQILPDLTNMLTFNDSESVMNAAGTMGTLAESHNGRLWMLSEACLPQTIENITSLLTSDNIWTASNAALVLARLTIAEEGCEKLLKHNMTDKILTQLITSLGVDEAGRGMNAAFAIGRLCDLEAGRLRLLSLPDSERMITSLAKMLCCNDPGASKNACFALSCLATNKEGHQRLLKNSQSEEVLRVLSQLLSSEDGETGWFAAMTLHTLASQPRGCLRLRENTFVVPALKSTESRSGVNEDLLSEVTQTTAILKTLDKPAPPQVDVLGSSEVKVTWTPLTTKSGLPIKYQLFENSACVWTGPECMCSRTQLSPNTQYSYRVRGCTEGDDGPLTESVTIITDEALPGPPTLVRILGATTTQLKVGWDPPEGSTGTIRGYSIYLNDDKMVEHTQEHTAILSGLTACTTYEIQVCASSVKGKGPRVTVTGTTAETGAHAPSKPEVNVLGRSEMHVSWRPPEVPLGRLSRYDVLVNSEVVYSGTDLHTVVRRLKADTEYTVIVLAVTSEGKVESKQTKKKTAKDEFEGERAPLYQTPLKAEPEKKPEHPKSSKKRKKSFQSQETASKPSTPSQSDSVKPTESGEIAPPVDEGLKSQVLTEPSSAEKPKKSPELRKVQRKGNVKKSMTPSGDSSHTPHTDQLHRPKPTNHSSGRRQSNSSVKSKSTEEESSVVPKGKHENCRLRANSHEIVLDADSQPPSRGSRRGSIPPYHSQSASSSAKSSRGRVDSLPSRLVPQGVIEVCIGELPAVHSSKQESEVPWFAHSKRSDLEESLKRMYSQGVMHQYKQGQPIKPSFVEFDGFQDILHPNNINNMPCGPTNYMQRATTFISSHSSLEKFNTKIPSTRKQLERPRGQNIHQTSQWQPDLSYTPSMRNHNKFVPMQFRTQPLNLPGVQRQGTVVQNERNYAGLEVLSRSQTEVNLRSSDHSKSLHPDGGHRHQNHWKQSNPSMSRLREGSYTDVPNKTATSPREPAALSQPVKPKATSTDKLVLGLGVTSQDNAAAQSAR